MIREKGRDIAPDDPDEKLKFVHWCWNVRSIFNFRPIYLPFHFFQPLNLCDIEQVTSVLVTKEDEISQKVDIQLKDPEKEVSVIIICLSFATAFSTV